VELLRDPPARIGRSPFILQSFVPQVLVYPAVDESDVVDGFGKQNEKNKVHHRVVFSYVGRRVFFIGVAGQAQWKVLGASRPRVAARERPHEGRAQGGANRVPYPQALRGRIKGQIQAHVRLRGFVGRMEERHGAAGYPILVGRLREPPCGTFTPKRFSALESGGAPADLAPPVAEEIRDFVRPRIATESQTARLLLPAYPAGRREPAEHDSPDGWRAAPSFCRRELHGACLVSPWYSATSGTPAVRSAGAKQDGRADPVHAAAPSAGYCESCAHPDHRRWPAAPHKANAGAAGLRHAAAAAKPDAADEAADASKKRKKKKKKGQLASPSSAGRTATPSSAPDGAGSSAGPRAPDLSSRHQHVNPRRVAGTTRLSSDDGFWQDNTTEERAKIREFWLHMAERERRMLVQIEKEAVLRKMKEQQKQACSCAICGRKRNAIEEELEVLYDTYYEELENYANQHQNSAAQQPRQPAAAVANAASAQQGHFQRPAQSRHHSSNSNVHHNHHHQQYARQHANNRHHSHPQERTPNAERAGRCGRGRKRDEP
ncbi:MAG: salt tolerance down-regulator-domain-containing protein, partial [Olpidium bornovanus]